MGLVALLLTAIPGCQIFGIIANAFFPSKVAARYHPADRPTLILVDDPANQLNGPAYLATIASHVGFHLTEANVLSPDHVISPYLSYELADRLGEHYTRASVDRVGKEVGAQQVIHLHIQSVQLQEDPGMLRPSAVIQVKIIDVTEVLKLFPSPDELQPESENGIVSVVMPRRVDRGDGMESLTNIRQALAERIARDVARLFFDYLPRQPGEPFD